MNTKRSITDHVLNTHVPGSVLSTLPELSQIIILIQPCEVDTNMLPFSDEATKSAKILITLWKATQLINGRTQMGTQFCQMYSPSTLIYSSPIKTI